jgi:hypothetical protein
MKKTTVARIFVIVVILTGIGMFIIFINKTTPQSSKTSKKMTETQARVIAQQICIKGGETLGVGIYNKNSKTWWFDANLNSTRPGCNPACVVNAETKKTEINWRCTGLILPTESE